MQKLRYRDNFGYGVAGSPHPPHEALAGLDIDRYYMTYKDETICADCVVAYLEANYDVDGEYDFDGKVQYSVTGGVVECGDTGDAEYPCITCGKCD